MLQRVLSAYSTSISKFKSNPNAALSQADGEAVAVSSHNQIQFYAVPAAVYEKMVKYIEQNDAQRPSQVSSAVPKVPARNITTDFLAAQLAGSSRIEGVPVSKDDEKVMRDVIEGKIDVDKTIDHLISDFRTGKRA